MGRVDSLEKTLMPGGIGGRRRRGRQRMRWLDGITNSMDIVWVNSGSWWWTGRPGVLQFMGSQRVGHDWATELNWIEYICFHVTLLFHPTFSFPDCIHKSGLYVTSHGSEWPSSKKSTNNKCWSGCGENGTLLHFFWECKLIHPVSILVTNSLHSFSNKLHFLSNKLSH